MWQRGVVVAVTDSSSTKHPSLIQLTLAAIALPGLLVEPVSADENSVSFLHEHYQEAERDLAGMHSKFKPIEVDTVLANLDFTLNDEITAAFKITQDTWSGATPVATAPVSARGNRVNSGHVHVMTGASIDGEHIHDPEQGEPGLEPVDTHSSASPYLYSSLKLDANYQPLQTDADGNVTGGVDRQLVHTLSSASPEVRQQFDLSLTAKHQKGDLTLGLGHSRERDFDSWFGQVSGSWDFNQQLTTLSLGLSYASSHTDALLDHDAVPHIYEPYMLTYERRGDDRYFRGSRYSQLVLAEQGPRLQAEREDWGLNLGLTQILNQTALINIQLGFTHSLGYQSNPYKAVEVAFVDPAKQKGQAGGNHAANYMFDAELVAVMEQRPDLRNQGNIGLKYVQYIKSANAALHSRYRYFRDSWEIEAHTLEIEWIQPLGKHWTLSPSLRYYSQSQAGFYTPYLVSKQGLFSTVDALEQDTLPFVRDALPAHYSSDARLSAYGTLTTGITLRRALADGIDLEFSYDYRQQAGDLKWGGSGEAAYADLDSSMWTIALNVNLPGEDQWNAELHQQGHHQHAAHHGQNPAPAGVQMDHMLEQKGDWMLGYRIMDMQQGGAIKRAGKSVDDYTLVNKACYGHPCYLRPTTMNMRMHMLDIMYAPRDWLTLMLMPQFVDMSMGMRLLDESPRTGGMDAIGMAIMHAEHGHRSSGLGDTELHGLFKLYQDNQLQLQMGLGLSLPTAEVDLSMRPMMGHDLGLMEYGMQLGSGTWDLKPSLTVTAQTGAAGWGAQITAVHRLEDENESGYALGNQLQSNLWASYQLLPGFSTSVRGVYTQQQAIKGRYQATHVPTGPGDYTANYGGEFVDMGLGLSLAFDKGSLAGNYLGIEWLQPVSDKPNGYQLEREGTLVFNWGIHL